MELFLKNFFEPPLTLREKLILPFTIFGLAMAIHLVFLDIKLKGYCPSLGITPVCYLTANAYIMILLSIFFVKKNLKTLFFFAGAALGISIALYFSVNHLLYINHCAMIFSVADCYYNFFLFFIIFVIRTVQV